MQGGRHIRYASPTPLANLHLTMLDKVGVRLDSFADSQGQVDGLFADNPDTAVAARSLVSAGNVAGQTIRWSS